MDASARYPLHPAISTRPMYYRRRIYNAESPRKHKLSQDMNHCFCRVRIPGKTLGLYCCRCRGSEYDLATYAILLIKNYPELQGKFKDVTNEMINYFAPCIREDEYLMLKVMGKSLDCLKK